MSDKKELAQSIFTDGIENNKTRDEIIIEMVQNGLTLNTSQILFKEFAKDAGMVSSRGASRKAEALEWLQSEGFNVADSDTRSNVRAELVDRYNVATGTANDYIKAYAEAAGIELPTSGSFGPGADGEEIYQFIKENFMGLEKPVFKEFMEGLGRAKGSIDETWRGVILARRLFKDGVFDLSNAA
jgi:hypothetical protein